MAHIWEDLLFKEDYFFKKPCHVNYISIRNISKKCEEYKILWVFTPSRTECFPFFLLKFLLLHLNTCHCFKFAQGSKAENLFGATKILKSYWPSINAESLGIFLISTFCKHCGFCFPSFLSSSNPDRSTYFPSNFLGVSDTILARSLWKSSLMDTSALLHLMLQKCCQSQNWYLSRGDEPQSTPRDSSGKDSLKLLSKALSYWGLFSNIQIKKKSQAAWKGLGPQAVPPTLWTLVSLCKRALMAPARKTDKIPESLERQISRQASHSHFGWAQTQAVSQVQTIPRFSLWVHGTTFLYTLYNTGSLHWILGELMIVMVFGALETLKAFGKGGGLSLLFAEGTLGLHSLFEGCLDGCISWSRCTGTNM